MIFKSYFELVRICHFEIDESPIKCKKHKENNMINVKRKCIVNNNSKITYKKGYI